MPGASFLSAMVPFAIKTFGFEPDAFVHELVDSIIGDNYSVPDRMLIYNDVEGSEKVKVYDKGIQITDSPESVYQLRINYRAGDMWAPRIDNTEALRVEVQEFVDAIKIGRRPLTDGEAGLRVVRILEAATNSMALRGQVVEMSKGAAF